MARVLALLLCGAALAGTPDYRGRPLTEALDRLEAKGLRLLYSTAVVTDGLIVSVEPGSTKPRAILEEILRPLGLASKKGPGGTLLIVRAAPPAPGRVQGRIVSEGRRRPVVGATVSLAGIEGRAVTDPDGRFEIAPVGPGIYTAEIAAAGFVEGTVQSVEVAPAGTAQLLITLQALPTHIEEIVVTPGRHAIVQEDEASTRSLTSDDAMLVPNVGGDVSRVVQLLPGVTAPDHSAAFHVRGSDTRDVAFVLDGLELYAPFHLESFQSPFSFLDAEIVDAVDVFAGGFTANMGDRHGGFVELASRAGNDPPRTAVELGTLNARVSHAAPIASGSLLLSARTWYPEALRDTTQLGEDGIDPRFRDLYARVSFGLSPKTVLSAHTLWATDHVRFSEQDGGERVQSDSTSGYLWLRALRSWTPVLSTDTVLSAGRLERLRVGISEPEDVPVTVEDERRVDFFGLRQDVAWTLSGAQLLKGGFEVRPMRARYRRGPASLDPDGTSLAAHVAHRSALSSWLALEVGARWDAQTYTEDDQWSPRLNAIWRPAARTEVRLGLGRFYQSQRIYELRVEDGETTFLPAERSDQVQATFQHGFGESLLFRVDAYDCRLSGLHPRYENRWNPLELFPETEQDRVLVAPESARLRGVELLLRGDPGNAFHWWVSYVRSSAEDDILGERVPRSWDQPHTGKVLLAYRWDPGWFVSLAGTAHTGWPTTPVAGGLNEDGEGELVLGPRNADRFPTYARLDLKVSRTISRARSRLRFQLEVLNVTDRANVCCVDEFLLVPRGEGTVDVGRELDMWLGITPSFSVQWEF